VSRTLGFELDLDLPFDTAVERVTAALGEQGFGVLTRVDVHQAFKQKLGVEFRPYVILGACNPNLAHRALSERPEAGLLLPCNVTVESTESGSRVRIIDPDEMMKAGGLDDDPVLGEVGREARARLSRVARALGGA
jgi:uncharacterized protein (DUF302 family)